MNRVSLLLMAGGLAVATPALADHVHVVHHHVYHRVTPRIRHVYHHHYIQGESSETPYYRSHPYPAPVPSIGLHFGGHEHHEHNHWNDEDDE
jgi:hypothetical protein